MSPSLIVVGSLLIALPLVLRISAVRIAKRNGRDIRRPRGWILRSPMLWAGVVVATIGINQKVGSIVLGVGMIVLAALIVRAVIKAPNSIRQGWRHIGNPDAWRGTPSDRSVSD
jgi:hypothetical protein